MLARSGASERRRGAFSLAPTLYELLQMVSRSSPPVWNPTLVVFVAANVLFIANVALAVRLWPSHPLILLAVFPVQVLLTVLQFTPMHEAVHGVASRRRWLNEAILLGVWPVFPYGPHLFRRIHLIHHARTNAGDLDPDHFTAAPNLPGRWVRSMGLLFAYLVYIIKAMVRPSDSVHHAFLPRRPGVILQLGASLAVQFGVLALILLSDWAVPLMLGWVLPSMAGVGVNAFLDTAWPHHPAESTDRYEATRILLVPTPIRWLLMNQNLHFVHHYKPNLRWYEYPGWWAEHGASMKERGVREDDYRSR